MKTKLLLLTFLFIPAFFSFSEDLQTVDEKVFALDLKKDAVLFSSAIALNAAQIAINPDYARWHGERYSLSNVNALDRLITRGYSKKRDDAGSVATTLAALAPSAIYIANPGEWKTVTVMYAQSFLLAYALKELGKDFFDRTRPYMYHSSKPSYIRKGKTDWHNSFPSGHTTMAFTGAAFASYVFGEYHQDTKLRWLVTGISYSLAASTAALRISSGNHFITDTMAGAFIGTLCGVGVPWLHHQKHIHKDNEILSSLQLLPNGFMFSIHL